MSDYYALGNQATLNVCVVGEVTGRGEGWVEINGHRLPLSLGGGVCHVSMDLPVDTSDLDECDECLSWERDNHNEAQRWADLIRRTHDYEHLDDAWALCPHSLCRAAKAVDAPMSWASGAA